MSVTLCYMALLSDVTRRCVTLRRWRKSFLQTA